MYRIALIALVALTACGRPSLRTTHTPPALGALTILAQQPFSDSFPISSAIGFHDCSVLVADSRFGRIGQLEGGVIRVMAQGPAAWRFPQLDPLNDDRVAVWSNSGTGYLGVLDRHRGVLTPIVLSQDPWGAPAIGPLVGLDGDRYAVVPVGNPYALRREPDARPSAPDIEIHSLSGAMHAELGAVTERGGRYLTWRGARGAIGRAGPTILDLRYADATLLRYASDRTDTISLGRYFDPPPIREEFRRVPWIQVPDQLVRIVDAPAVQLAVFAPDGRLYAVRNYRFVWRQSRDPVFGVAGSWEPVERGLEIYDPNGARLGAYALPPGGVEWLRADGNGRIFAAQASRLLIIQDPTRPRTRCE
jgi:hypothetical protein